MGTVQMPPAEMPPAETTLAEMPPEELPPEEMPPAEMPPEETPPAEMPPAETPPAEAPPAEMPPAEMPPAEMPPAETPPAEMPPAEAPPAEMPLAEAPTVEMSPVEMSPAEAPPSETPPAEMSPAEMPPAEAPPAEMPPAEMPPAEMPPAETPPAEMPPAETAPAETAPAEMPQAEMPSADMPPAETPPAETPPAETPPAETPPATSTDQKSKRIVKLITVFAATSYRGIDLIDALLTDPNFKVRGVTQFVNSEKANKLKAKGVEIVSADVDDPVSIGAALDGAYGCFIVTNFQKDHQDSAKKILQNKNVIEVANATGVHHFVYSGLENQAEKHLQQGPTTSHGYGKERGENQRGGGPMRPGVMKGKGHPQKLYNKIVKNRQVCRHFKGGGCWLGSDCGFDHPGANAFVPLQDLIASQGLDGPAATKQTLGQEDESGENLVGGPAGGPLGAGFYVMGGKDSTTPAVLPIDQDLFSGSGGLPYGKRICRHFAAGCCKLGSECAFYHPGVNGPSVYVQKTE